MVGVLMHYASISVSYSGFTTNVPAEEEDGGPSKASLTLSAVEYVLNTAAQELGIPMFHEYSWPDGSCYKVIAAADIKAAVAFLEAAVIDAAPKLTRLGAYEIPAFTINGVNLECELPPDSIRLDWRGDKRTIEQIFAQKDLPSPAVSEKEQLNRKQRRVAAAIARDKRIVRDP